MVEQALMVRARLVQDSNDVEAVASMCGDGVAKTTAALIYVACGCRITRCRKVVHEARMALRGHRGGWPIPGNQVRKVDRRRYQEALLANVLVLAKRTTPPRQRRQQKRQA